MHNTHIKVILNVAKMHKKLLMRHLVFTNFSTGRDGCRWSDQKQRSVQNATKRNEVNFAGTLTE